MENKEKKRQKFIYGKKRDEKKQNQFLFFNNTFFFIKFFETGKNAFFSMKLEKYKAKGKKSNKCQFFIFGKNSSK